MDLSRAEYIDMNDIIAKIDITDGFGNYVNYGDFGNYVNLIEFYGSYQRVKPVYHIGGQAVIEGVIIGAPVYAVKQVGYVNSRLIGNNLGNGRQTVHGKKTCFAYVNFDVVKFQTRVDLQNKVSVFICFTGQNRPGRVVLKAKTMLSFGVGFPI